MPQGANEQQAIRYTKNSVCPDYASKHGQISAVAGRPDEILQVLFSLYSAGAYRSDISTNTQSYAVCIKSGAFENLRRLESISSAVEGSFHTRRPRRSGLGHRCLRDSRNSQGSVVGASRSRHLDFLQTIHVEGSWLKTITE